MGQHGKNTPDYKVNECAVEFQKARYEESLLRVKEEEPNLPIVKQQALAAKKVRWNKVKNTRRGSTQDEYHIKDLHRLCQKKNIGGVCSRMTYPAWKTRFKVNQDKLDVWSRKARRLLVWGIVDESNANTNKKLGELTSTQINQTALGKAITTFNGGKGLCTHFTDVKISIEALVFLSTIRDRTFPTIPSVPGSISHLYANNKGEATHCALIDFESNQVLLKLTRGVNLNIDGKTLLGMSKEDIEEAVCECVKARRPLLSKDSREFLLEFGLRCITIKWCKHVLHWMIGRFEKKLCCLLDRVIDTTELKYTSILDTIETMQKIPTQSTTTSTRRKSARRKTSPSSLELKAAFFPSPGEDELVPRRLCIGQENNHYPGACTNEMPMSISRYLAICLSIPMLLNMNAGVAISSKLKGTQQEKEDTTGVSVDGKTIVKQLKASFEPAKKSKIASKNRLAVYKYGVPKATSSDTGELSNTEILLNDTLTHNKLVRARRRGIIITEDGNEALSNDMEEEPQTLSTLDSDSQSGSEPAKKKTRRTSVESSSPTQSNPVEGPSSESRRVFMHGGHNNGKTAKPWDKEAKRHRAAAHPPSSMDKSQTSILEQCSRAAKAKKSASSSLAIVSDGSSPSNTSDDSVDSNQEQNPRVTRLSKRLDGKSQATKSTSTPAASKKKEKQSEKKRKWQVAQQAKSSTKKPDCNCSYCTSDSNNPNYTQTQHRNVQTMAAYNCVMEPVVDDINPSNIEKEYVYFPKEAQYDLLKGEASVLRSQDYIEEMDARGTCDTEHLIGRLEEIFNSIYTTFPCSHTSNRCYSVIRWLAGDWCYGLSELKYKGGN